MHCCELGGGVSSSAKCMISIYTLINFSMQKPDFEVYCVLCTTVKHFEAVVMTSLSQSVSGREGFFPSSRGW